MVVVLCNVPPERADDVSALVVTEGLAACVNALPVRSTYRWEGALCREDEVTLLIKTSLDVVDRLAVRLREVHPYTLPEIIVLQVDAERSLGEYVAWVRRSVATPTEAP
jgi:periplasmic divalent cation tolerance protein